MNEYGNQQTYDLESIIAEFSSPRKPAGAAPTDTAERSRHILLRAMDDVVPNGAELLAGRIRSDAPEDEEPPAPVQAPPEPAAPPQVPAQETPPVSEVEVQVLVDADERAEYAAAGAAELPPEPEPEPAERRGAEKRSAKERFLSPLVALLALIALRREQRKRAEPQQEAAEETPEPPPEKAVKLYGGEMRSLKLRAQIATGVSLVALYLSFAWNSALPLTGALDGGVRAMSLLLLILEITAVMAGLDIFTKGLLDLAHGKPGAESLTAVTCVLTMLDAAVTAAGNKPDYGIPFCAISTISMTFAVWGAYAVKKARRAGARVLASSKSLYTVTGERGITPEDVALLKARGSAAGFLRRSEEPDFAGRLYEKLTPFLLIAAVVLGLLASVAHRQAGAAMHCIASIAAASAAFSCTLCFAVPYAAAARRLSQSGAAIAGWSGVRDTGRSRHVIITDADVFPKGTVEIGKIRILEGAFTDKVISYTGSVIAASGSGLAGPFADLIRRNGYTISKVENFESHDGGGMTAAVAGESVMVGGAGFMNLMGIRIPQKLATRASVYTAINGALVGIFMIEYRPTSSVQDALVLLLHSKLEPVFAIRDFNITPAMLKSRFKLPTDSFRFPPYSERYRISGAEPAPESRVAAVLARDGMGPLVEAAERGRRTYLGVRAAAAVAAVGSVFGLVILFLLCWTGAFDSASARNVITFMLLWLIPLAVAVFGMER